MTDLIDRAKVLAGPPMSDRVRLSHECPECGQCCYCDGEDHGQPAPDDCDHECGLDYSDDDEDVP